MIRLSLIIVFLLAILVSTLLIMNFAYSQKEYDLLYLGLSLPVSVYVISIPIKMMNRIEVRKEYFILRNLLLGKNIVVFSEIEQWEENQSIRINQRNLLVYSKGRKFIISNMSDLKNYEILRGVLKIHWPKSEKLYPFSSSKDN